MAEMRQEWRASSDPPADPVTKEVKQDAPERPGLAELEVCPDTREGEGQSRAKTPRLAEFEQSVLAGRLEEQEREEEAKRLKSEEERREELGLQLGEEQGRFSPSATSSSPGGDMLGSLRRASPQGVSLGQITSFPGLLAVGPLSPRLQTRSPHPGAVGSGLSSPAHSLPHSLLPRPHLSHQDLSSPRREMSPVEHNLAALASITGALEHQHRVKSGPLSGSSTSVGGAFTLPDFVSNEGEDEVEVQWSDDQQEPGGNMALSNLAALVKLEEMERSGSSRSAWPQQDTNLFLPLDREGLTRSLSNLGIDAVSPGNLSPSLVSPGHSSMSPLPLGLTVPGMMANSPSIYPSPISPMDSQMPGLGLNSQSVRREEEVALKLEEEEQERQIEARMEEQKVEVKVEREKAVQERRGSPRGARKRARGRAGQGPLPAEIAATQRANVREAIEIARAGAASLPRCAASGFVEKLRGGITSRAMAAAIVEMGVRRKQEAAEVAKREEASRASLASLQLEKYLNNLHHQEDDDEAGAA